MDLANYLERYRRVEFHDGLLVSSIPLPLSPLAIFPLVTFG
jgi:hypothetical protein